MDLLFIERPQALPGCLQAAGFDETRQRCSLFVELEGVPIDAVGEEGDIDLLHLAPLRAKNRPMQWFCLCQ